MTIEDQVQTPWGNPIYMHDYKFRIELETGNTEEVGGVGPRGIYGDENLFLHGADEVRLRFDNKEAIYKKTEDVIRIADDGVRLRELSYTNIETVDR